MLDLLADFGTESDYVVGIPDRMPLAGCHCLHFTYELSLLELLRAESQHERNEHRVES